MQNENQTPTESPQSEPVNVLVVPRDTPRDQASTTVPNIGETSQGKSSKNK